MAPAIVNFCVECRISFEQLKKCSKQLIYGSTFNNVETNTEWCLKIDCTQPNQLGIGVCLLRGAPYTLHSYTIYIKTNEEPPDKLFIHTCDIHRDFEYDGFCQGFQDFCSLGSLACQKKLIRDKQTNTFCVCCDMIIFKRPPSIDAKNEDLQFSTTHFSTRTLDQWILFLKSRIDFPMLNNKVNEEIEKRMSQGSPCSETRGSIIGNKFINCIYT